jgi:hypothetical protein
MNRTRFLTLLVAGLVLLNLGTLAFFRWGKMPPPRPDGPRKAIIQRLHFDDTQVVDYEKLIAAHRAAIDAKEAEIRVAKEGLYQLLGSDDLTPRDSLIARIGAIQQDIEHIHFDHFKEIKALCKGDQVELFKELSGDLAEYFSPGRRPAGPGKKPAH